ncbi:hypothetical protein OROGR_008508 [Orobanche gracilis]
MNVEEFMKSIGGKTYKLGETLVPGVVVGCIMKRPNFKWDPSLYKVVKACATLAIEHYNEPQLVSIKQAKRAGQELESIPAEELGTFKAEVFNGINDKNVRSVWKLDEKTV